MIELRHLRYFVVVAEELNFRRAADRIPMDQTPLSRTIRDLEDWAAAGFVDTDLSFLSFLELYRTDVAERRVTTRRVVEPLDVIEHISAGLFPGPVHLSSRALSLQ